MRRPDPIPFFPQLVKTADLDPRQNYVVGFHPHGVLVAGGFTNFCTFATGFRQLFPGITSYLLMLPLWFRAPFFRDYIMCAGVGQQVFFLIWFIFIFMSILNVFFYNMHIYPRSCRNVPLMSLMEFFLIFFWNFKKCVSSLSLLNFLTKRRAYTLWQGERHLSTLQKRRRQCRGNCRGWGARGPRCSSWNIQCAFGQEERLC